ncbi:MFS general substrate transporter [Fomitopsis serialis]|uniref:MFS general substrate transporter n=1 Tax=Fomitopsis serialis TaxID=139415 RepID=UPI002008962E|nr:MFS general substrate transporter [Neoantrodia serialis]KAH9938056.1 MFS general substrate transporter [Neoantrodia serialis]
MSQPVRAEAVTAVQDVVEVNNLSKVPDTEVEVADVAPMKREEPVVTRRELWSYYCMLKSGRTRYSMTLFQNLATSAGWDPSQGPGSTCTTSEQCVLPWGSGTKSVSSIVLVANGLSFAIMTLIFTTIGSAADYGTFGRWLLLAITVICWAAQFASMALTEPSRWGAAMAIYIISFVSYGATLVFYAAAFPRLARNTPHARHLRDKLENQEVSREEYEREESLEKNRVSNLSTWHSNIGYIFVLCLNLSILLPLANNALVDNYTMVLTNMYWIILGIWWYFVLTCRSHFPAASTWPPLPKGEHYLTIGWKQIWIALRQWKKLPYTFIYLFAFFLLSDGLNTTGTLISIFSFLKNTYLGLAQAFTSTASTIGFWWIQKYWKIPTKKMFVVTNVVTILIPLWGMIGLWTTKFGFHQVWEYWAYNVVFGLFQAPYYAFSQTMMAELAPPGFDNMRCLGTQVFGLFGLSNRASSMIGPNVIQAIINNTQNNWKGFPFLFALCTAASVDVEKGRRDAVAWADRNRSYAETGVYVEEDASLDSKDYGKKA